MRQRPPLPPFREKFRRWLHRKINPVKVWKRDLREGIFLSDRKYCTVQYLTYQGLHPYGSLAFRGWGVQQPLSENKWFCIVKYFFLAQSTKSDELSKIWETRWMTPSWSFWGGGGETIPLKLSPHREHHHPLARVQKTKTWSEWHQSNEWAGFCPACLEWLCKSYPQRATCMLALKRGGYWFPQGKKRTQGKKKRKIEWGMGEGTSRKVWGYW